jgi:hypothetical protein
MTNVASPTSAMRSGYASTTSSRPPITYHRGVKALLIFGVVIAVTLIPLYRLRVRWVVDLWRRAKLVVVIYCVVVFVAAITRLIFNFDAIYG